MANRLADQQSPYLLQHAHNPVHWWPWGDDAFHEAQALNRPIIVSIGYSACHWCHVMERESFEDAATAAFMNEHFICIKVDREEHPDVDALYMDAVQALTGSGGWPLNVFVTPDRVPFYGGTYYPPRPAHNRPSWLQLLQRMATIWKDQPDDVKNQADQMMAYLRQTSDFTGDASQPEDMGDDAYKSCAEALLKMADKAWGGFGGAPKFPGTMAISFLIEHHHFYGNEEALHHALLSLDKMIAGGIYDQLGGGFARYSTDQQWLAPHFEKMLYDNALLILAVCDAYAVTRAPHYQRIIDETIAFVNRELKDSSGGYYCALDADSEGVEGKFYTWTWPEWIDALGSNNELVAAYFGVRESGNWEGTNILHITADIATIAGQYSVSEEEAIHRIEQAKTSLLHKRNTRIRPGLDDKCLLSWNALMNLALSRAGKVLQRPDYIGQALTHATWMLNAFSGNQDGLFHTLKNGKARIPAKLDDYAYLIQALIQLGSISDQHSLIKTAAEWAEYVEVHFSKEASPLFNFTSDLQTDIPVRKVDVYDGATPSANAFMMHNLYLLGLVFENDWLHRAEDGISSMISTAIRHTYSFSYWALLAQQLHKSMATMVIVGKNSMQYGKELALHFTPKLFILCSLTEKNDLPIQKDKTGELETLIFVCTSQACLPPVHTVKDALRLV